MKIASTIFVLLMVSFIAFGILLMAAQGMGWWQSTWAGHSAGIGLLVAFGAFYLIGAWAQLGSPSDGAWETRVKMAKAGKDVGVTFDNKVLSEKPVTWDG